ncbi:MAG: RusA family crossover junction endodeoxyribonuclease [Ruminococcaceae bacterium]|nr:RusA family crossover junction endodeoxyribonuclease [Oscillospiraceae bacterium]
MENNAFQFFMPMKPPTVTHQEKNITVKNGKPVVYEPPELADARAKLTAHLAKFAPKSPYTEGVRLIAKWLFPRTGKHNDGEYKLTKPDTDNLNKLLKDCMTKLNYWKDDAQVASEIIEKFYGDVPGIFIRIEVIE